MERRKGRYYLCDVDLGESGPYDSVYDAVNGSEMQYGMDYMFIETTLDTAEVRRILRGPAFILSNVGHLAINDVRVDPREIIDSSDT